MAKGDIDFKELFSKKCDYKTPEEYRDAIVNVIESNEKIGLFGIILNLGFRNEQHFYDYKVDDAGFVKVRDTFIDNLPCDLKEFLYTSLKNKHLKPTSSLTPEQRRLKTNLNNRLNSAIKGKVNTSNFYERFGYTQQDLVKHLESFFDEYVNWSTYGQYGWHIDHIKPVSAFDWSKDIDSTIKECFALSNLRPLNWRLNLIKGNKYECA